ncbi:MAG: alpha/beta hydrolase [Anaerolineae bacterium]|nr:alpha/beta hydrolase [Anaerolineae bacterium]
MASIQGEILKNVIKRQNYFGGDNIDLQQLRDRLERMSGSVKPHRNVQVVDVDAASVPSEWLIPQGSPTDRALFYIHGGAWSMGSTNTHRSLVSNLAYLSGIRALSINYRLAPEHPFPAGLEDCITAYEWLLRSGVSPDKVVIAGDSAGGNLAFALLVTLRDAGKPLPAGAVALSPATDLAVTGESYKTRRHLDPYFANLDTTIIADSYIADHDPRNPLISPLFADLGGLPPLLIHVGEYEVLHDDAVHFGERAVAAGVKAKTVVWSKMFHVFQMYAPYLPEARQANDQIAAFIRSLMSGEVAAE